MYQLWLTPTSQQMMASGGSTAWQSATTRSGRIGDACSSKFGRMNFSHSARHFAMSASHALVAPSLRAAALELGEQLTQERARIGEDAEIGRIIAAKLGRIDVDMDELGVRKIPRIARHPRRGRTIVEARADGDDDIGAAAGFVGRKRAVSADEAERQRDRSCRGSPCRSATRSPECRAFWRTRSARGLLPTASRRGR